MTKRPLLALTLALAACAIAPGTATAGGLGLAGASGGVTVPGSPYRYVAISPGYPDKLTPHALTVVVRIDRRDGRVDRWWYLKGFYYVPAVAYDGTGGGLSADGRTLVLERFSIASPPITRLAILRTDLYLRHPLRPGQHRPPHAIGHITLDGNFSFDAISPDGSTAYLTRYRLHDRASPHDRASDDFEQRTLDTRSGELSPRPVIERPPAGVDLQGVPISRAYGPDGRWVYTLYDGDLKKPFLQILDTVESRSSSIALPQIDRLRNPYLQTIVGLFSKTLGSPSPRRPRFLSFTQTPRLPGNLLGRTGIAGHSVAGRPIEVHQLGDPALDGEVLVFGCIHGDECAASGIEPVTGGCPDPHADIFIVRNLNPDGAALGTRLNGRGVDLNRNFPADWKPIGERGDPQYSGPHPFSEPETRLAARIVRRLRPETTIWFHQRSGPRPLVRAWGQSAPTARRFARLAGLPFHLLPWPAGTAPNWQNHRFPGTASFVVELPPGPLSDELGSRLDRAVVRLGWEVGED